MKSKLLLGSLAGIAVVGGLALTPIAANAQTALQNRTGSHTGAAVQNGNGGGYQASLEARAKAVNMTAEQLNVALKTQTMDQIMADKGVSTEAYQAQMRTASKARWESRGLSADEVQQRVEWQQNRQATATHDGTTHEQGGYGRTQHAE